MDDKALERGLEGAYPVLSNRLILALMEAGKISIDPFDADRLAPSSYHLCPHHLRFYAEDDEGVPLTDRVIQLTGGLGRDLRPGEYAVVSPRERIVLGEGFIVDFYPSSWCIENKLLLTAGRLDSGYTADLVFGVFNGGRSDVHLTSEFQLVRASFGWMGHQNIPIYTGMPPGAYIPQLSKLREREAALEMVNADLQRQKDEIARLRERLLGQRHTSS